jgi:hypothetical protein
MSRCVGYAPAEGGFRTIKFVSAFVQTDNYAAKSDEQVVL